LTAARNSLFDLSGKTVLITGASSGLGRRAAVSLAANGAHVIACARRIARLEDLVAEIASGGGSASVIGMHVEDPASVCAAMDRAFQQHEHIDVLVNNAGVGCSKPFLETEESDFDSVFDVNVKGVFRTSSHFARRKAATGPIRRHHQCGVHARTQRPSQAFGLLCLEGGRAAADAGYGDRAHQDRHSRQRHLPRLL